MSQTHFPYKNELFIYDIANNHQGSLLHGYKIIDAISQISNNFKVRGAMKLQLRDLDTYLHPLARYMGVNNHVQRFEETKLSYDDLYNLGVRIKQNKMLLAATPFDEKSVKTIQQFGNVDIVKIASCSAQDWNLIGKAIELELPMVVSTGGLSVGELDRLFDFLEQSKAIFALMHCVSLYPCNNYNMNLKRIQFMKEEYIDTTIGWSTHEYPENTVPIVAAYLLGARMFERHVGITEGPYVLNTYSSTPEHIGKWLKAYYDMKNMVGEDRGWAVLSEEKFELSKLKRGVYAKTDIKEDDILTEDNVYFAFPYLEGKLSTDNFRFGINIALADYKKDDPISDV